MESSTIVIIVLFFAMLFVGVWLSAEYNTIAIKKKNQEHLTQVTRLKKQIAEAEQRLQQEKDKVMELQSSRLELTRLKKEFGAMKSAHELLSEEHSIFLELLKQMKRKAQRTEFNGTHLSRIIISDIEKMANLEKELKEKKVKVIDQDTEKMFSRIKEKMKLNG